MQIRIYKLAQYNPSYGLDGIEEKDVLDGNLLQVFSSLAEAMAEGDENAGEVLSWKQDEERFVWNAKAEDDTLFRINSQVL